MDHPESFVVMRVIMDFFLSLGLAAAWWLALAWSYLKWWRHELRPVGNATLFRE